VFDSSSGVSSQELGDAQVAALNLIEQTKLMEEIQSLEEKQVKKKKKSVLLLLFHYLYKQRVLKYLPFVNNIYLCEV
jgi:hypothetical protein